MKLFLSLAIAISVFMIFNAFQIENHDTIINNQIERDSTENYLPYHEKIREALVYYRDDEDYPKTIATFKAAFEMVSCPFAIDVTDALKAAIAIDDKVEMFGFCRLFAEKGCGKIFFEREDFEALKKYPNEYKALQTYIDSIQAHPEKYWNVELREQLEYLYREDQRLAKKYRNTDSLKALYRNWVLCPEYDSIVKRPFLNLVKTHGIIGAPEIGFALKQNEQYVASTPFIMILHTFQRGENRFSREELEDCVKRGVLSKFQVKQLIENSKHNYRLYPEVCEMINRGADEDSISTRIVKEWGFF